MVTVHKSVVQFTNEMIFNTIVIDIIRMYGNIVLVRTIKNDITHCNVNMRKRNTRENKIIKANNGRT